LIGLSVARNQKTGCDVRNECLEHSKRNLVMYAFSEAHSPIQKAAELLGL
jgi:glutamate/tyrosine decarboxylase-like PLP-dependent enzyme